MAKLPTYEEMGKKIAEEALDGYIYKGKTLREWIDILAQTKSEYEHSRKFEKIVVEYPPVDSCIYPEYKGKPYFSIKYEENEKHIMGFGTYNPEVFSRYLREYFIMPTIIETDKEGE